jgi:hypothetical protein
VVAAVGVSLVSHRPLRPLIVAGLAALAPCTAWLVFVRARGFDSGPYEPSRLVDVDFLAAEGGRFTRSAGWMLSALVDDWLVAVVLFGCAAAIALTSRRNQGSLFLLVWAWLSFVGLATTYLVSTADIDWHLRTSADRVVMTIGLAALVSVPILVVDALTEPSAADSAPGG